MKCEPSPNLGVFEKLGATKDAECGTDLLSIDRETRAGGMPDRFDGGETLEAAQAANI